MPDDAFDIAIIGAGSAGLTGATFAAKLGVRVALIEKNRIGGDCTWTGCVPSKAIIKAARIAHEARRAAHFGVDVGKVQTDMKRVREYVRKTIARIYEMERPEILKQRGITAMHGAAEFIDAHTIRTENRTISASRVIVCTGARPVVPPIEGLGDVPFSTYETLFDNDRMPAHFMVIGAGPIGLEMALAYRRLGAEVTVIGREVLPKEEPEVRSFLENRFQREGIRCESGSVQAVYSRTDTIELETTEGTIHGDMLFVATGRRPNVEGLRLENAGVEYSDRGITVDAHLRTSSKTIYAAGDVTGGMQFTHLAGWQCFQAVRNALLPGNAAGFSTVVPAVTFVDPEIARVGMVEAEARKIHGEGIQVHRWDLSEADRAICDGEATGFIKIITRSDRRILGATIVASRAGEMIAEIALAMQSDLKLDDIAATIHAYPTWSTAVQLLAADAAVADFLAGTSGKFALEVGRWLR